MLFVQQVSIGRRYHLGPIIIGRRARQHRCRRRS